MKELISFFAIGIFVILMNLICLGPSFEGQGEAFFATIFSVVVSVLFVLVLALLLAAASDDGSKKKFFLISAHIYAGSSYLAMIIFLSVIRAGGGIIPNCLSAVIGILFFSFYLMRKIKKECLGWAILLSLLNVGIMIPLPFLFLL